MGKRPIRKWQLQEMAIDLQHRGRDATGFALMDEDGLLSVYKVAHPAWKAVALPEFHKWCDQLLSPKTQIMLCHTRAYTKGSPVYNENNHPLYAEDMQGVIVHNGMVRNDDELFKANEKREGFYRSCATDSDIFRAILDDNGGIDKELIKRMGLVEGTATVAAIHRNSPGKLLLLRDSNPLVLGATSDMLAFASTKEALHKVLKPWIKLHNLPMQVHAPNLSFVGMRNETGYIFGPNGLETHEVFKCNGRGTGGYVKYSNQRDTSYWQRKSSAQHATHFEKRHTKNPPGPVGTTVGSNRPPLNPTALNSAVKTLVSETMKKGGSADALLDPGLFEYVICPNGACNKHVRLTEDDRRLASISLLACKDCRTNLAQSLNASRSIN